MSCGKASYGLDKAKRMVRGISGKGKEMRYYKCDKCFHYHLTSEVRSKPAYNWTKRTRARQRKKHELGNFVSR